MVSRKASGLAAAILLLTPIYSIASTLNGSTVTSAIYCCTAPIESDRITNFRTVLVADNIEFPANSLVFLDGSTSDEVNIDIGVSTIDFDVLTTARTDPGTFNGYIFTFTGAPEIIGVSVNPVSVNPGSNFGTLSLSFTTNALLVSFPDLPNNPETHLLLDVSLTAAPEPSSLLLIATGVALFSARLRRSRIKDEAS